MATITILAIDGGGIRGMIPAAFLDALEQRTGHAVCDLFDYVAGTSTGGILALGLGVPRPGTGAPFTARGLMDLYRDEGAHIFSRSLLHRLVALENLNGPKYPADGVDAVLQRYFGGMRLKEARTNVLVTSYAIEERCPFFFRSWQAKDAPSHDYDVWQVARSTSAAPTYFPPHRIRAGDGATYALIDGGVYANNPALCAWTEAHDRHPGAEIVVVSLGTGNEQRKIAFEDARDWGLAGWAPRLLDLIFDGVSDTVDVELDELLNTRGLHNHFRFQTDLRGVDASLDATDPANLEGLRALGVDLARGPAFEAICSELGAVLAERAALNQPVPLPPVAGARAVS
ncbi:MAG TPA: patatin-like phospholipase family protein [Myxococcales bacterium]|jgi:patatin-like phospholipase/acyl hydrolase|nr:patatin-like phospholipase family protein [Myxococcales bacterium]